MLFNRRQLANALAISTPAESYQRNSPNRRLATSCAARTTRRSFARVCTISVMVLCELGVLTQGRPQDPRSPEPLQSPLELRALPPEMNRRLFRRSHQPGGMARRTAGPARRPLDTARRSAHRTRPSRESTRLPLDRAQRPFDSARQARDRTRPPLDRARRPPDHAARPVGSARPSPDGIRRAERDARQLTGMHAPAADLHRRPGNRAAPPTDTIARSRHPAA